MSSVLRRIITPQSVFKIVLGHVLVSMTAGVIYLLFRSAADVRGICGAIGFLSALSGSGVAFWFSLRMRAWFCFGAAVVSVVPLVFWIWLIYERLHQ
jgi:uncharacterized membrane protein